MGSTDGIQTGVVQFHRCLSACSLGTWQKGIADIKNDLIAKNHPHNNFFFMLFMGREVFTKLRFGSRSEKFEIEKYHKLKGCEG